MKIKTIIPLPKTDGHSGYKYPQAPPPKKTRHNFKAKELRIGWVASYASSPHNKPATDNGPKVLQFSYVVSISLRQCEAKTELHFQYVDWRIVESNIICLKAYEVATSLISCFHLKGR